MKSMPSENSTPAGPTSSNGTLGTNHLSVRVMEESDLATALSLSTTAGWNQTARDWQWFVQQSPQGCFVATRGEDIAGTVATVSYGQIAWVGMMLVNPQFQRQGIGRALMERALGHLADTPIIKLDATPAGQPLYEKLGFTPEEEIGRWTCERLPICEPLPWHEGPHIQAITPATLSNIVEYDCQVFGAPRPQLLRALHTAAPKSAWQFTGENSLRAFSLGRPGTKYHQIGPVAATDLEAAKRVTEPALHSLQGRAVVMDVRTSQVEYSAWLQEQGFVRQRSLRRMVKGGASQAFSPQQFAIAGPELG